MTLCGEFPPSLVHIARLTILPLFADANIVGIDLEEEDE